MFLLLLIITPAFALSNINQTVWRLNSSFDEPSHVENTTTTIKTIDDLLSGDYTTKLRTFHDVIRDPDAYTDGDLNKKINAYIAMLKFIRKDARDKSITNDINLVQFRKEILDELHKIFTETLLNGTFFEDSRIEEIEWYELCKLELTTLNDKLQMTDLFLQRILTNIISHLYHQLNVTELIEKALKYKNENLNEQSIRKAHVYGALYHAIEEFNDKENSNIFKLAYALRNLIVKNGYYWGSGYFQKFTESIRRLFPVCLKKIVFSNGEMFTMKNEFYNAFMVSTTNFKDVYLEQKVDSFDHFKWVIKFESDLFAIQTSNSQYFLKLDGSFIHANRGDKDNFKNELLFRILPSPVDDTKCIIQDASSEKFLYGVPDKSLVKIGSGPSPSWTSKYLWEIDIV